MKESTKGDKKTETKHTLGLSEAVEIVRKQISYERDLLQRIANGKDQDPIMCEAITSEGYDAHVLVDPAKVAQIMLNHQHPIYMVLEDDSPQEMWEDLASMIGVENVCSVDL